MHDNKAAIVLEDVDPNRAAHGAQQPLVTPEARSGSRRRRVLTIVTSAMVFGAGVGTGIAFPDDTAKLDAANSQVRRSHDRIEGLASTVASVRHKNAVLTSSLEEAQATAREAVAKEHRLDARAAKLDEREAALDSREAELAEPSNLSDGVPGSSSAPSPRGASLDFDRAWAVDIASDIVQEVKTVDHRLGDGIAVESAMFLLSGDFTRLRDAGIPPGVDEAEYVARLETLESFTDQAADLYPSDPTEASARYAVVREQTGVLLDDLNAAIGSEFRLD